MTQASPLVVQTPGVTYEAADFRNIFDTLFTEGVRDVAAGQLAVSALSDGTLRVAVAAGTAYVKGDDVANQGLYILRTPAGENVTVTAPPSSGSRLDLLVYEEIDADVVALAGRPAGSRFRAIPGTVVTSGSPVLPALPPTAIRLASFPIAAGQTTIPAASITDLRTQAGSSGYGPLAPPMTTTQRNAISNPGVGLEIFNTTTGKLEVYGGSTLGWVSGASIDVQTFTASGTWTKPAGAQLVFADVIGAGGGGGGGLVGSNVGGGGGGGGGARAQRTLRATDLTASVSVTIGAGGTAGPSSSTAGGGTGGDSSFGSYLVAAGGKGGQQQNAQAGSNGGDGGSVGGLTASTFGAGGLGAPGARTVGLRDAEFGGGAGAPCDPNQVRPGGHSVSGPGGGGYGGGVNGSGVAYAGTAGGFSGGVTAAYGGDGAGTAGAASSSGGSGSTSATTRIGGGGGGGGGSTSGAGTGGAGGLPGGGGGGGGTSNNGGSGTAGTGGAGARGEVRVITLCA